MELKSKNTHITFGKVFDVSLMLFGFLFIVRLYQLTFLTDAATGFFTDRSNITVIPMYILAAAAVILTSLLCRADKTLTAETTEGKPDYLHAACSLFMAVSVAVEGVKGIELLRQAVLSAGSLKAAVKDLGGYTNLLVPVLAVLSVFVFIADFFSRVSGKNFMNKLKISLLIPVLWAFFLTVGYFTITASYLKVAQLMFTIFSDAFLMLFFFEYARMTSGIGKRDAVWAFYATGIVTVGLTFVSTVPSMFFTVFAPEKIVVHCPFKLYSLAGALFAATAMADMYAGGKSKNREAAKKAEEKITNDFPTENE